MLPLALLVALLSLVVAFGVALVIRWQARRLGLVAEVGERSSHSVPTPSGGGVGIALAGTLSGLIVALQFPWQIAPVLLAAALMALLGYWDDRRPLPARWRLGAQVLLAGAVAATIPLEILGPQIGIVPPEPVFFVLVVLAGALGVNLFNFMDGIDGLAGAEAVFILAAALALSWIEQPGVGSQGVFWWMVWVAAACLGFLLLNWPPAKIFMGDAGSTYLGLMLFYFALATLAGSWLSLAQWLILCAAFLADSLTTLARRLVNREPVWQAHKRHAYQALQRRFGSHLKATLLYIAIDLILLLPLAWLAGRYRELEWVLVALVYVLLVVAALRAGAGAPLEPQAQEEGAGTHDRQ